jgi:tetratricopeptide (TPR) repeat protein
MSSAEENIPPETADAGSELNPMEGGRWRPVRPDELLRKDSSIEQSLESETRDKSPPKVELKRQQELEHHLKDSPTDLDAFFELGRIYRAENRPLEAKRVFQQALKVFPDEQELLWEHEEAVLARSLQKLREVTELSKRLDTAETQRELKRSHDDWAARRIDVCLARLHRDPSQPNLRVALAEAMLDAGMYEGAIEELESVLDHEELSPTAYLIRGRCLLAMRKDIEAMASLRAASLRRSVVAPPRTRVIALRLLCETAERLGVTLTLAHYRQQLEQAEQDLAKQMSPEN